MTAASQRRPEVTATDRVGTKRVNEPASPDDGTRVLVMRLWPRGTRKSVTDRWLKGLGTPVELIRQWKAGRIPWAAFASAYRKYLRTVEAREDLNTLVELARRGRVTLLCTCPEEARCHRGILKLVLLGALRNA
ncbi:MAG: DUF488 family protein [candidate division NC10 bacterium]|nr:DUF488 family protein [candidate division NC10 bacterium]